MLCRLICEVRQSIVVDWRMLTLTNVIHHIIAGPHSPYVTVHSLHVTFQSQFVVLVFHLCADCLYIHMSIVDNTFKFFII